VFREKAGEPAPRSVEPHACGAGAQPDDSCGLARGQTVPDRECEQFPVELGESLERPADYAADVGRVGGGSGRRGASKLYAKLIGSVMSTRFGAVVGEQLAASDAEQPEAVLGGWGECVSASPGGQEDFGEKVGGILTGWDTA